MYQSANSMNIPLIHPAAIEMKSWDELFETESSKVFTRESEFYYGIFGDDRPNRGLSLAYGWEANFRYMTLRYHPERSDQLELNLHLINPSVPEYRFEMLESEE